MKRNFFSNSPFEAELDEVNGLGGVIAGSREQGAGNTGQAAWKT